MYGDIKNQIIITQVAEKCRPGLMSADILGPPVKPVDQAIKTCIMGVFDGNLTGAAIKGSGDDLVDISRQTLTAVLPFSCPGAALTHAPDTEGAFKICENSYMHMNISN